MDDQARSGQIAAGIAPADALIRTTNTIPFPPRSSQKGVFALDMPDHWFTAFFSLIILSADLGFIS
jgi:hypothetical protein